MKPYDQLSPWALLGVAPGASADEIRHAYERLAARLAPGSLAFYSIADPEEQAAFARRLRAAYFDLLGGAPERPGAEHSPPPGGRTVTERHVGTAAPMSDEAQAPPPAAETGFDGASLRRAREAKGVSLEALSQKTRIRRTLIEAIEAESFDQLPQRVFVRGFIFAIARELGLEPELVWTSYGRRWEAWAATRASV